MTKKNQNISVQEFIKIGIVICILGDLLISFYIWSQFSSFEQFKIQIDLALSIIKNVPSIPSTNIPSNFHREIHQLMLNSIKFMISALLIVHGLVYLALYKQKLSALKYLKFMCWTAGVGSFFLGYQEAGTFDFTYLFFPMGILYIYTALKFGKMRYDKSGLVW